MTSPALIGRAPARIVPASGFVMTTSWDDGDPLDLCVAELLAKHGLCGTFYVPRQSEYPNLSATEIRELAEDFEIGGHTVHHLDLTTVMDSIARREIFESKGWLEETTGQECRAFCFPMGHFAPQHLEMVREAGFESARTVELLSLDRPRETQGVALMATTVQAYPHGRMAYWRNVAKRRRVKNMPTLLSFTQAKDWASAAIALLQTARERRGVFHLWGHSREIEETGQWRNLERVFAAMREMTRNAVCVSNSELCRTTS